MLDHALAYAAAGWLVLPLRPRGKVPLTAHGLHDATDDRTQIGAWWTVQPQANVGLATGARSGRIVIDLDGEEPLAWYRQRWPETLTCWQATGRGYQVVLHHPGQPVRNSASKLHPGVDVRGDGGYVVAPPSIHPSGGVYRWVADGSPALIPPDLLALICPPARERKAPAQASRSGSGGYGARALELELEDVVCAPEGGRNDRLNTAAYNLGQLVGGGVLDQTEVEIALSDAADRAGLGGHEIAATIRSGLRAGMASPRTPPERPQRAEAPPVPGDDEAPPWAEEAPTCAEAEGGKAEHELPRLICFADLVERPVRWIWSARIPRGKVTVLAGPGGTGKTTLSMDLAARVSSGRAIPFDDQAPVQGAVLVLSTEDDGEDTLLPRLKAAGADLKQCFQWPEDTPFPELPSDADLLRDFLLRWQIRLVIVDPFTALTSAKIDSHKDADVRRFLAPLRRVAREADTAIVGIAHFRKDSNGSAMSRVGASGAWVNAPRSVLLAVRDHEADDEAEFLVASAKVSNAAKPPTVRLRREVVDGRLALKWIGTSESTADEVVAERREEAAQPARGPAQDFLRRYLAEGSQWAADGYQEAEAEGISARTLRRAIKSLGVKVARDGEEGRWYWTL